MSSGSYQQEMDRSNLTQQQHGLDGHHHGSYSQQASLSLQQEQGSQEAPQQDMLTQQLHQLLVADTTRFWTATVAPSAQSIHQVSDCGGARLAIISGPTRAPHGICFAGAPSHLGQPTREAACICKHPVLQRPAAVNSASATSSHMWVRITMPKPRHQNCPCQHTVPLCCLLQALDELATARFLQAPRRKQTSRCCTTA